MTSLSDLLGGTFFLRTVRTMVPAACDGANCQCPRWRMWVFLWGFLWGVFFTVSFYPHQSPCVLVLSCYDFWLKRILRLILIVRYTSYVKLNISTLSHALCVGFMICDSVDPIHSAALGIGIYLCKLVVKSQNHSGFAGKSFRTMYDIYLALGYWMKFRQII